MDFARFFSKIKRRIRVAELLDPNQAFIIKIDPELRRKILSGDADFMTDQNGDLLGSIFDFSKKGIGGQVRLIPKPEETAALRGIYDPLETFSRLDYERILEKMLDISDTTHRIEQGQNSDRTGLALGNADTVFQALNTKDENTRRQLLINTVNPLNQSRQQLLLSLQNALEEMGVSPGQDGSFFKWVGYSITTGCGKRDITTYKKAQECMYNLNKVVECLAVSYVELGEPENARAIIAQSCKAVFALNEQFEKLQRMEPLMESQITADFKTMWYNNPCVEWARSFARIEYSGSEYLLPCLLNITEDDVLDSHPEIFDAVAKETVGNSSKKPNKAESAQKVVKTGKAISAGASFVVGAVFAAVKLIGRKK